MFGTVHENAPGHPHRHLWIVFDIQSVRSSQSSHSEEINGEAFGNAEVFECAFLAQPFANVALGCTGPSGLRPQSLMHHVPFKYSHVFLFACTVDLALFPTFAFVV